MLTRIVKQKVLVYGGKKLGDSNSSLKRVVLKKSKLVGK